LLFLGGDNPGKGAADVGQMWRRLVDEGFTGKLHWFGKMTETFKASISRLPRNDCIALYGYVPRSTIFSVAAKSKVLLMLSRTEPFGMATIEAMSMGCVPIAWDIETGTREIIERDQTGFVAPLGDFTTLARHTKYVCHNHHELVERVVRRARDDFGEAVMWSNYAALLSELAGLPVTTRSRAGQEPSEFRPARRRFQRLPRRLRQVLVALVGRSPRLGRLLGDLRGL
jgi:glycosyltransferase involved in cell wall biosynthesis